ncbi:MAG: M55 family metallopeptidase [Thermomicrobiales bacterium]|nr:M55 family metallopeptidase [Thermomicrobiales bacterium]MCO5229030.1 M55 family metallopeptidase [Thermomicrobiales bacterium]
MKILISADMEGTCGVSSWVHVQAPEVTSANQPASVAEYERFRRLMTAEVNAAIRGAFRGGATEIIVNDSHDFQRNLVINELDSRVTYISGADKRFGMMQGIDQDIDAIMYTGYHARAGTVGAPLAHTWNTWVHDVRFNGVSTGEFGINAAIAGHFGTGVIMVAGDDQAVAQTQDFLGDQIKGAVVKWGISSTSARHLHPVAAEGLITGAAEEAVSGRHIVPYRLAAGTEIQIDADHQSRIDQMLLVPGVQRVGNRTASFTVNNGLELNDMFRLVMKVGGFAMNT